MDCLDKYFVDGISEYQKFTLNDFHSMEPITGEKILEVGGSGGFEFAYSLNNLLEKKVFIINPNPSTSLVSDDKIEVSHQDGCNTNFEDGSFDLIIGSAVLEHIIEMESFAKEMFRILAPNGKIYMQGRPIWTSGVGHHIFVAGGAIEYRFNGNNPIDDFDHLILTKEELKQKLIEQKNIPPSDAEIIVEQVYHNLHINRLSPEEILNPFLSLPFSCVKTKILEKDIIAHEKITDVNKVSGICLYAKK